MVVVATRKSLPCLSGSQVLPIYRRRVLLRHGVTLEQLEEITWGNAKYFTKHVHDKHKHRIRVRLGRVCASIMISRVIHTRVLLAIAFTSVVLIVLLPI
jgi:hypothetical protein